MISIVIVGFNSRGHLPSCLNSIYDSDFKQFRVIFVDNNSSDNSAEYLKQNFPKVAIIESKKNLGFAAGNNLGIKKALELKSDYIMLLNPDTVMDKKCLSSLVQKAEKNTILQPLILLYKNGKKTNLVNTTGNYLNFLGISYCNDYKKDADKIKEKEITTASGAAAFIPTNLFKKIEYFDEDFFMYHEDVDLFWRARMAGFSIRLVTSAKVWHDYSFSKSKQKFFYIERNRLTFLLKNFSIKYLLLILPIFIINEILMILFSILSGWFLLKMKSYYSFLVSLPPTLKKKTGVKKTIKTPENHLKDFLMAPISFSEINNQLFQPYNILLSLYWKLIYYFI